MAAWTEFREMILRGNAGKFVLFLLMTIVVNIAVAIAQGIIGCVTCCGGFLPYISTVLTLPLVIFLRAYPIYFLQQFGPQYVIVVEPSPPPPVAYGFPMAGMPPPPVQQ